MKIPDHEGFPTVSATQLRTYGAGGFRAGPLEEAKGCPRQYRKKYVEHDAAWDGPKDYALAYGSLIHEVLWYMEEHACGPDEALTACFPPDLPPEAYEEAVDDLKKYMERGSAPVDRFATVAVEQDLTALLYVDDEFGPIYYRGIVDWLGIDPEDPTWLHSVDYKSNRTPPSKDDMLGDVQLKGYHWLVAQNWSKWMRSSRPLIVTHLDVIKFHELEHAYSDGAIEAWHSWAVAVVRAMLRDEKGLPVLNPGCGWCPVRGSCPAFQGLPTTAQGILTGKPESTAPDDERIAWRDTANATRLLLEKAVKEIDDDFKQRAASLGSVVTGSYEWTQEPDYQNRWDLRQLWSLLGEDTFFQVVTTSKAALERLTKDWPASDAAAVMAAKERTAVGTKIAKRERTA